MTCSSLIYAPTTVSYEQVALEAGLKLTAFEKRASV